MTHSQTLEIFGARLPEERDIRELEQYLREPSLKTPSLMLSRSAVSRNYQSLKAALPRVNIHYAVKPNNHIAILDEVRRCGGSFDVCSKGEIDLVLKTGARSQELIHSHPIKSIHEFDAAVELGVKIFVVDNFEEVKKLQRYTDRKLKVLVRYRINVNTTAVVNLQYKFGCLPDEVVSLAREIERNGHEFYGLCYHIGSQCTTSENHVRAIEAAHGLIVGLDMAGFNTRLLDIGGGFPVEYVEPVPDINDFCRPIAAALDEHIRPGIQVVSEPGRYIAATSTTLVTTVIGKAMRDGKLWYYLDDGLYSTFSGIVFDQCQYPVITAREGNEKLSVLAGPTCDSFDVMYDGLMIPEHEVGERMLFLWVGAYCAASGSSFNELRRPQYRVTEF